MSTWYIRVLSASDNDREKVLGNALVFFENELQLAKKEIALGGNIEAACAKLPAFIERRYGQLQELEAILRLFEIEHRRVKFNKLKGYLESYNKQLTTSTAEKYAEADTDVIALQKIINHIALMRNNFLGILKSLDNKAFQLNNVVKLRTAGLEDAEIDPIVVKSI